jgi:SAM-dependent methyltransferase
LPQAFLDNVAGHRAKWLTLNERLPANEAKNLYVGGGDPLLMGFMELEVLRSTRPLDGADIIDIGCGIGRLTRHLLHEPIKSYLGLDIIEEVLAEARSVAADDRRFHFAPSHQCRIPTTDSSADFVVGFSLITHLLNEEIFEYLQDARRVLRSGGHAVFSFFDLNNNTHRQNFVKHSSRHRHGDGDLLVFTTRETLAMLANLAGFKQTRFRDGTEESLPYSGIGSSLIPPEQIPQRIALGQSVMFLQ